MIINLFCNAEEAGKVADKYSGKYSKNTCKSEYFGTLAKEYFSSIFQKYSENTHEKLAENTLKIHEKLYRETPYYMLHQVILIIIKRNDIF
jgi:hypothetical protein